MTTQMQLGMAKKQASNCLNIKDYVFADDYFTAYKGLVRRFMQANSDLDREYLDLKNVVGEKGEGQNLSIVQTPDPNKTSVPSPSSKWKNCPKCNGIMHSSWNNHIVCGWDGKNADSTQ